MEINVINDPRKIPQSDMPIHGVFSNQATSLISFGIDWRTRSVYDHFMDSINQGKFICQDFGGFHEIPMDGYLIKGGQLKFVKLVNANEKFNIAFRSAILNHLAEPWYKKIYGFANVLGRAIGIPWLNIPGTYDCSMIGLKFWKDCCGYLPLKDSAIIMAIPNTASPSDLDDVVQNNPDIFSIYGEWSADEGVVV